MRARLAGLALDAILWLALGALANVAGLLLVSIVETVARW